MKKVTTILLVAGFVLAMGTMANADTILIDYDNGTAGDGVHDASILNGGFEDLDGNDEPIPWGPSPLSSLKQTNDQSWTPDSDSHTTTGTYHGGIEWDNRDGNERTSSHATDTNATGNYTISVGDSYDLSFWHKDVQNKNKDIDWSLYYTNDDTRWGSGGQSSPTYTVLFTGTVNVDNTQWIEEIQTDLEVTQAMGDDGATGRHLWLAFDPHNEANNWGPSGVDDVTLTYVPEPASLALIGLGGIGVMLRRRRR